MLNRNSPEGSPLNLMQNSGQVLLLALEEKERRVLNGESKFFLLSNPAGYWHNASFKVTVFTDAIKDNTALGFPKNSEFLQLFNYHLSKLMESGIIESMQKTHFPKALPVDLNPSEALVLGYENVLFPFLILIFGLSVSIFCSCFEICGNKAKSDKSNLEILQLARLKIFKRA